MIFLVLSMVVLYRKVLILFLGDVKLVFIIFVYLCVVVFVCLFCLSFLGVYVVVMFDCIVWVVR